jgi:hypothetical protein
MLLVIIEGGHLVTQLTLLPELPDSPAQSGIVYLMTDWYKIKWGWSGRRTPTQRSGELRASVIGFIAGTRADEAAYHAHFKRWCVGGEWFSIPDDPVALHDLWLLAVGMGQWQGIKATESLARVIANNLRRAA